MILQGDCLDQLKTLPDESVDCCITSPPYYGLRDYGIDGQIGLEQTPEEYVARLVEVFREVRRVLKPEGTLWLNLGDSYSSLLRSGRKESPGVGAKQEMSKVHTNVKWHAGDGSKFQWTLPGGQKPKDLIGVPWMVAFALRADGWYLRSDIIWQKPNCMPESVTDRPTKSHEYLFLLSKSQRYYYDSIAVQEESITKDPRKPYTSQGAKDLDGRDVWHSGEKRENGDFTKRNKRTVWTIPTKPFPGSHFAVFPEKLIEPCILAGTSEKGYCPTCGKPWVRQVERSRATYHRTDDPTQTTGRKGMNRPRPGESDRYVLGITQSELAAMLRKAAEGRECEMEAVFGSKWAHWIRTDSSGARIPTFADAKEIYDILGIEIPFDGTPGGWLPSCQCASEPRPGIVLDPFSGAGTVALVAKKLGRHYIGIELNPAYVEMAKTRINKIPARLCRWVEDVRQ